jgi:beta-galactosidase
MAADRANVRADGKDLSFVTIAVVDKDGRTVPRSKNQIRFEITGPGEIAAVDNGDPTSHEPFQAKERRAYNGLALVIVRTIAGKPGKIRVAAMSNGLVGGEVRITSQ